jgi:hypothetical protein
MNLPEGYAYEGPFIKQTTKGRIVYDENYVNKSRTTVAMAYLRVGWLSAHMSHDELRAAHVVDIGSGAGVMVDTLKTVCASVKNYDLCGNTISLEELRNTDWDIVVLNDVLEHYDNIAELFELKWRYAFISFPETPDVADFNTLQKWRHFRPDEHIYHLHERGMREWVKKFNARIVAASNFEDILRTRWNNTLPNITTMLIARA